MPSFGLNYGAVYRTPYIDVKAFHFCYLTGKLRALRKPLWYT
jgi:hypothetical protein